MRKDIKCRYCKSTEFVKEGFRRTLKRGKIQKYMCLQCKKCFTQEMFYK